MYMHCLFNEEYNCQNSKLTLDIAKKNTKLTALARKCADWNYG